MKYINLEYHPHDSRIKISDDDVVQTLNQRMGTGGGNVPIILVLNDQGEAVINWSKGIEDEGTNCTGIKSESCNDNG